MSEIPPPFNQKSSNQEPNSFNWKTFILVGLVLVTVLFALFGDPFTSAKQMNYTQFKRALDQGRVELNPDTFLIKRGSIGNDVVVQGFVSPDKIRPKNPEIKTSVFKVPVNLTLDADEIKNISGQQLQHLAFKAGGESLLAEATEVISLLELRKAFSSYQIKNNPCLVLDENGISGHLVGKREEVTNLVEQRDKSGKEFKTPFSVAISSAQAEEVRQLLESYGATYKEENNTFKELMISILPFILLMAVVFFIFRQQMKGAGGRGAMSFGKSKAKLLSVNQNRITFSDVAGIQESKEELVEIVEYLRDPRKFQKLGATIPKGVLMVGPPGTGKTLLARAVAGEADVPFFSISGSDFVEMFVGVGASRVRDMFEQGKKSAPCLIFIDEIDAVGRHRGHGIGGGNDEREQTLNQLLVEMDGFDAQEGVIIIAATNRADVLDPALLRPGRFDRQVNVNLPDVNGREEILRVHVKKIKLAAGTDLSAIARGTPGFSGAELANLINEAALLAARKGMNAVTLAEMEESRDKVRWGRERRSMAMSETEKAGTAWHEAGHAYLNVVLDHMHPLHKVTIIPRGPYLGATMYLPEGDKYSMQKKEALASLVMTMGGRIAENFYSDDISNGASGDIRQATSLARHMVCQWGMSDTLGMVELSENNRGQREYSSSTAKLVDDEVKKLIDNAFAEAKQILTENRHKVQLIAEALLTYETLDEKHVRDLIERGEMQNPPHLPMPPPVPDSLIENKITASSGESTKPNSIGGDIPTSLGSPA